MTESTAERLLEAAEALFAEEGFEGASLRAITSAADANLAAVAYHFGSKDGLIEAVFERRIGPVNRERFARLDAALTRNEGVAPVEEVVEAFLGPAFDLAADPRVGPACLRLLGRAYAEPTPLLHGIFERQFRRVAERFVGALAASLPHLDPETLVWRFHFCVSAMAHVMVHTFRMIDLAGTRCDTADAGAALRQLVPFLSEGLRSPAPAGPEGAA